MATVYSLVCWGGKDGKTAAMTIASPCVVSLTNHGLRDGTGVVFSTTGALPTGVTAGATYYSRSTASGTFNLYDTAAHAIAGGSTGIVNTSGSQSGTHTAKGAYYLGLADKSRWTTGGTERIFNGLNAAIAARRTSGAAVDTEVFEIGEAFVENLGNSSLAIDFSSLLWRAETKIDGVRSSAFHFGTPGTGYCIRGTAASVLSCGIMNTTVDGIEVYAGGASTAGIVAPGNLTTICNNMIHGVPANTAQKGISGSGAACRIYNNIVYEVGGAGFSVLDYHGVISFYYNNLATKCVTGFVASVQCSGSWYNNISIGNTINWGLNPGYSYSNAGYRVSHNVGATTDRKTCTADASTNIITCGGHVFPTGTSSYSYVRFETTGTLPAPLQANTWYRTRDQTASGFCVAAAQYGTAIDITDAGSGTHSIVTVWDTRNPSDSYVLVDFSDPSSMFVDYDNNDFRPTSALSPQVERGISVMDGVASDITDAVRPNYVSATHPNEAWDIGPFEFDHGEGLAPQTVPISVTGMASGSEIAIYKASDMSVILAPQSTTGSYSGTYTYTGDTNIIVRVRKGTAATRYLPYEYAGTITSTGFQLVVSQIPDTIAQ